MLDGLNGDCRIDRTVPERQCRVVKVGRAEFDVRCKGVERTTSMPMQRLKTILHIRPQSTFAATDIGHHARSAAHPRVCATVW